MMSSQMGNQTIENTTFLLDNYHAMVAEVMRNNDLSVLRNLTQKYLTGILVIIGLICNCTALVVMLRQKYKTTTTLVLQVLLVVNSIILILAFIRYPMYYLGSSEFLDIVHGKIQSYIFMVTHWTRLTNTWLIVLLTIDRCIAVSFPLHAQRLCTRRRTSLLIVLIVLLAFFFSLPRCFEYRVQYTESGKVYSTVVTELAKNRAYSIIYGMILYITFMYAAPMCVLVVLNIIIVRSLRRWKNTDNETGLLRYHVSTQSRDTGRDIRARSRGATRTVIVIVVLCIIETMMAAISHILYKVEVSYTATRELILSRAHFSNISNIMIMFNCSINFFIYYVCSQKFREDFVHTLRCKRKLMSMESRRERNGIVL